jgi:hypothetical protein
VLVVLESCGGLRDLRGALSRSYPQARTGGGDGQPPGPQESKSTRKLIEQAGASVMLLPPYSPDFSPIEQAFSKVKNILRKVQARTHEVLVEAIGRALDAVSRRDALGWFEHCGYYVLEIWRKSL